MFLPPNSLKGAGIVVQTCDNAPIAPFSRPLPDTGITPIGFINCISALPRRITMGMDEMFGWKTKEINRRSPEMTGAFDGGLATMTNGLMAGTRVASNLGWRTVEALAVGDSVLTFDNGMQEITEVRRVMMWIDAPDTNPAFWPVIVPAGALDNRTELTLLADQGVLVESDAAADMYGDPFAVVPAQALVGVRGIHRAAPQHRVELIVIAFADEQVIYAEGGALIHCPVARMALDCLLDGTTPVYDVLGLSDATYLAGCLTMQDQMLASGGWVDGQAVVHC